VLVATTGRASVARRDTLRECGCEVLEFAGFERVPIEPLLAELGRRGMTNLLVEGGGAVAGSFFDAGQVDALDVYIAPLIEGGNHARTPVAGRGRLVMRDATRLGAFGEVTRIGEDLKVKAIVPQPWRERAGFESAPAD
jgi:diaminohydroxyphosphoribosylaminopyrimidine deaminase/5-amino-6-(5-phosphoribosylamino)uracil reductase